MQNRTRRSAPSALTGPPSTAQMADHVPLQVPQSQPFAPAPSAIPSISRHIFQPQHNPLAAAGQRTLVAPIPHTARGVQEARYAAGIGREPLSGRYIQIEADIKFGTKKDALFGKIVQVMLESKAMAGKESLVFTHVPRYLLNTCLVEVVSDFLKLWNPTWTRSHAFELIE